MSFRGYLLINCAVISIITPSVETIIAVEELVVEEMEAVAKLEAVEVMEVVNLMVEVGVGVKQVVVKLVRGEG